MKKNSVFKEIIFTLLLCLLILLVLALILYNYVPANKTLPDKISYTTPTSISRELAGSAGEDEERVVYTYEVDEPDMNNYERVKSYNPGKSNPFTKFKTAEDGTIITNPKGVSTASDAGNNSSNGASGNNGSSNGAGSGSSSQSGSSSNSNGNSSSNSSSSKSTSKDGAKTSSSDEKSEYANPAHDTNQK